MKHHSTHGGLRRAIATAGAFALAMMGAVALAGPAAAADVPNLPDSPYTLNVHKFVQPGEGTSLPESDGNPIDTSGLDPLEGVTFSVAPVDGVDLTTAEGWQLTEELTVDENGVVTDGSGTTYTVGSGTEQTTDSDGLASFTNLDLGVYLVTETDQGSNAISGTTAPFLVTLPYPHDNGWLSTLNVYPKNALIGAPTKSVDDSDGHGLGSTVTWTITAPVPSLTAGQPLDTFTVSDDLAAQLSVSGTPTVTLADADGAAVTLDAADYDVDTTDGVTVTFTDTGRDVLADNGGGEVTVVIDTTVTAAGTIENSADLTVNTTTTSSLPAQTTWGEVELLKVDESDPTNALEGAEFQVFTSESDASTLSSPVSVDGESTFTSGEDGIVSIPGLRSQDDGAGDNLTYYIVETKAPVGYNVNPAFSQDESGSPITVLPGTDTAQVTVTDPQIPGFELPITGGGGTAIFVGGGIAIVALGLGGAFYAHGRKRRATQR